MAEINALDGAIKKLCQKRTSEGTIKLSKNPTALTLVAAAVLKRAMDGAPEAVKLVRSALEGDALDSGFKLEIEVIN